MAIAQSAASEGTQLHGLAFGAFDTATKVLNLVNQLLGHPAAPPPAQPADVTEMVSGATGFLTEAMRKLEAAVQDAGPAIAETEQVAEEAAPVVSEVEDLVKAGASAADKIKAAGKK